MRSVDDLATTQVDADVRHVAVGDKIARLEGVHRDASHGGHLRTHDAREGHAGGGEGLHHEAGAVPAVRTGAAVHVGVTELADGEVDGLLGLAVGLDLEVEVGVAVHELRLLGGGQRREELLGGLMKGLNLLALDIDVLGIGIEIGLALLELATTRLQLLRELAELFQLLGLRAVQGLDRAEAVQELGRVLAAHQIDRGAERRIHVLLRDQGAELALLGSVLLVLGRDVGVEVGDLLARRVDALVDHVDLLVDDLGAMERVLDVSRIGGLRCRWAGEQGPQHHAGTRSRYSKKSGASWG